MAVLLPSSADYSDRDQNALAIRLRSSIDSVFPTWSDKSRANFGNILIEAFAYVGGVLNFYQDNQAAESRLVTAQQRRNLLKLVKMLDYAPATAHAAQASVTFTVSPAPLANVTLPIGTVVSTESVTEPTEFQLLSALVLTPGAASASALVEHSETQTDIFVSEALANQSFLLAQAPFIEDSLSINCVDGTYTEVPNFLSSTGSDKHFTVEVDNNDRATVRFGNGANGVIPPSGNITCVYKTGGGESGNVEASTITKLVGNFTDSLGNPVSIIVTNSSAATGGSERESEVSIKESAPLSVRTAGRTVSREDYEINASEVAGIDRTLMLTRDEDPLIAANTGYLYIVPTGADFPAGTDSDGSSLYWQAKQKCTVTYPNSPTFVLNVVPPVYLDISVNAKIFMTPGYNASAVAANVRARLASYFALRNADGTTNTTIDFGQNIRSALPDNPPAGEFPLSDLYNVVRDTPGVRKVGDAAGDFLVGAVRKFSDGSLLVVQVPAYSDIPLAIRDFPRLNTSIPLTNGDTGAAL